MAKTKEITFMCESNHAYSTHESKIKVIVEITHEDLGALINSIPADEIFTHLPDSDLEKWAKDNGFVKL